jgi:anti-sigma factor RsiW
MTHPSPEQLVSFLYGEVTPQERSELRAHLQACVACQAQLQTWRGTAKTLDDWPLPQGASRRSWRPVLQWAAAAVIVLGLGFGAGRLTWPGPADVTALRASLESEFQRRIETARAELSQQVKQQQVEALAAVLPAASEAARSETQRLVAGLAKSLEERTALDHQRVLAALQGMDDKWGRTYGTMRRDLETVAVLAENGFQDTQRQLVELATYTQSSEPK